MSGALLGVAGGGLLVVFGLWWVYFCRPAGDSLRHVPAVSFLWGYGHYLVFAAVGALGAGLEVAVESALHAAHVGGRTAAYAVAVPVAVTLLVVGVLQARLAAGAAVLARCAAAAVLVLLAALLPLTAAVLVAGAVLAALVLVEIVADHRVATGTGG